MSRLFEKYIFLPLWFLILRPPVKYRNFEKYLETLEKINDSLANGNRTVISINGRLATVKKEKGEISINYYPK